MPVQKGKKYSKGYATVTGEGLGYREIAEIMTESGHKMSHSSAKNYFLRAMRKLAEPLEKYSNKSTHEIAIDPDFQAAIIGIIKNDGKINI